MRALGTPQKIYGKSDNYAAFDTRAHLSDARLYPNPENNRADGGCVDVPPVGLMLSSLGAGYIRVNRDYVITDINAAALHWLRLRGEDVLGQPFTKVSPRSPMRMLQNAVEGMIFTDRELPSYQRPDRWMDFHVYPVKDGAILFSAT